MEDFEREYGASSSNNTFPIRHDDYVHVGPLNQPPIDSRATDFEREYGASSSNNTFPIKHDDSVDVVSLSSFPTDSRATESNIGYRDTSPFDDEMPRKRPIEDDSEIEARDTGLQRHGNPPVSPVHTKKKQKAIVDLTLDSDNDSDVVETDSKGNAAVIGTVTTGPKFPKPAGRKMTVGSDAEVCIGSIQNASVKAYQVPYPKGSNGTPKNWPRINVTLRRLAGRNQFLIRAEDSNGALFGTLDFVSAKALAPLMIKSPDAENQLRVRLVSFIESRPRKNDETIGVATSVLIPLMIHVYARESLVERLGIHFNNFGIRLGVPQSIERGTELRNPHAPKKDIRQISRGGGSGFRNVSSAPVGFITRSADEIRDEVSGMFDTLRKDDDIPRRQPPAIITTQLLAHQEQALWFLTDRETEREIADKDAGGDNNALLWKKQKRILSDGRQVTTYYNVITGSEYADKPDPPLGGILADMMGLGKTLNILSLLTDTMDKAQSFADETPPEAAIRNVKATLIICPTSTTANWEEQIQAHIQQGVLRVCMYHGLKRPRDRNELADYDIVITTYGTLESEWSRVSNKPLHEVCWFRIVLDEAHEIRNASTRRSIACVALMANRRWAVTGTPVQNRLEDLGALFSFLHVQPFNDRAAFKRFILDPFRNAEHDIVPKLRLLMDSLTLRRTKDIIKLPKRNDQYVRLTFDYEERKLHDFFKQDSASRILAVTDGGKKKLTGKAYYHVLRAILRLRQVCAHGSELLTDADFKLTEGISASNAIYIPDDDEEMPELSAHTAYDMLNLLRESELDKCSNCGKKIIPIDVAREVDLEDSLEEEDVTNELGFLTPCWTVYCTQCKDVYEEQLQDCREEGQSYVRCNICGETHGKSLFQLTLEGLKKDQDARQRLRKNPKMARTLGRYNGPHTKTKALLQELEKNNAESALMYDERPIKSVVLSGWTSHLDLIAIALTQNNFRYVSLVGEMSRSKRAEAIKTFATDHSITVMLVSINAGGLGLNLTAANKVYVMEPQYNPAAEAQAVDRVHRLGQEREVDIMRFIMQNSFEEQMLMLQEKKRHLAELTTGKGKLKKGDALMEMLVDLKPLFK